MDERPCKATMQPSPRLAAVSVARYSPAAHAAHAVAPAVAVDWPAAHLG